MEGEIISSGVIKRLGAYSRALDNAVAKQEATVGQVLGHQTPLLVERLAVFSLSIHSCIDLLSCRPGAILFLLSQ